MAIIGNRFMPHINQAVDILVADNRREKELFRLDEKEKADQQRKSIQDIGNKKINFLSNILTNSSADVNSKGEASGLITQIIGDPEFDISSFEADFNEKPVKQAKPDRIVKMPALVKEYFKNAPDEAEQSVVKLFMDAAIKIRGQDKPKGKGGGFLFNFGGGKTDQKTMITRLDKLAADAKALLNRGILTDFGDKDFPDGIRKPVELEEVAKYVEQVTKLRKAVQSGKVTPEIKKQLDELQPFVVGHSKNQNGKKSLDAITNTQQEILKQLQELDK